MSIFKRTSSFILILIICLQAVIGFSIQVFAKTVDEYNLESKHFIWDTETSDLKENISTQNFKTWLSALDGIYEAYVNLTEYIPLNGEKIKLGATKNSCSYASAFDDKIRFDISYLKLRDNNPAQMDMLIGEEIAHIFDFERKGVFNEEGNARLMIQYAFHQTGYTWDFFNTDKEYNEESWYNRLNVVSEGYYFGDDLENRVFPYTNGDYWTNAEIMPFWSLAREDGWESLKKTYRSYYDSDFDSLYGSTAQNPNKELWDFIDRLEYFSGKKLKDYFLSDRDWNNMLKYYPEPKIEIPESLIRKILKTENDIAKIQFKIKSVPSNNEKVVRFNKNRAGKSGSLYEFDRVTRTFTLTGKAKIDSDGKAVFQGVKKTGDYIAVVILNTKKT